MNETALAVRAPMDLTERIQELHKLNYNVLLPVTTFASQNELFVPRLDIVVPNLVAGDFYKQGSKKVGDNWVDVLAPAGQFLNKIASAANIQWHPDKCGHTVLEKDRVVYKAVAALRQADGQWRTITDEYELDLEVIREELEMEYKKKAKTKAFQDKMKKEGMDLEDYIHRDYLQKRRHKLALAASGAMNRVIRKALTLRSTYPESEARNPFAIARFDFQPDYDDPTVRRYASIAAIQAQNDLYGQGSAPMPEDVTSAEMASANEMMSAGSIANIDGQFIDVGTGEITNPIDVDPVEPEPPAEPEPVLCSLCGKKLEPFIDKNKKPWSVQDTIDYSTERCGQVMCIGCAVKEIRKRQKAEKEGK